LVVVCVRWWLLVAVPCVSGVWVSQQPDNGANPSLQARALHRDAATHPSSLGMFCGLTLTRTKPLSGSHIVHHLIQPGARAACALQTTVVTNAAVAVEVVGQLKTRP
jgi:hypothetical protein